MSTREDGYYEGLLMKAVDGLLTEAEERELGEWLEANPDRATELDDFVRIKEVTDQMAQRLMADARIEPFRETPGERAYSWIAFALVFGGLTMMLGYGFEKFLFDEGVPAAIRYGAAAAAAGALALFLRVLWIRLRAVGEDPYEEVDR